MNSPSSRRYEDEIDLLWYGRFLAAYWMLLLLFAVVGMLAAVAIRSRAPLRYQATATMAITTGTTATPLTAASAQALVANLSLVAATISDLKLNEEGVTPRSFIESALQVQPVPATNLLRVSVSLPDPTKARLAASTLTQKAAELSRKLDQEGAVTSRDATKKQMDEAALRLDAAQERLLAYQTANHLDLLEQDTERKLINRNEIESREIEIQAEKARLTRMEEELARQPKLLEGRRTNSGAPVSRSGGGSLGVNSAYDGADAYANPVYSQLQYDVAQSKAKVSGLEEQVRRMRGSTKQSDSKMMNALYQRRIELKRLQADLDVSQRVYDNLATQYEAARGRVVGIVSQLQTVDAPVQPDAPLPRGFTRFAILGAFAGLMVGAVTAVILNRRRTFQAIH